LDNAHIIPYHITHQFPSEDMLALCPTCHRIADDGEYSQDYLRRLKSNPFNSSAISEKFIIENKDLILNLGGNKYINCPKILTINDYDILTMKKEEEGFITIDLSLFNRFNKLIGVIDENKWTFDTSSLWDVEYKPKYLRIRNPSNQIIFEIRIEKGEVFLYGELFYAGQSILISKDDVNLASKNLDVTFKGMTIVGAGHVFNIQI
jgi:hypothetical protein